jgi:hypothetical protein
MSTPSERIRAALDRPRMNPAGRLSTWGISQRPAIIVDEEHLAALLETNNAPRKPSLMSRVQDRQLFESAASANAK